MSSDQNQGISKDLKLEASEIADQLRRANERFLFIRGSL